MIARVAVFLIGVLVLVPANALAMGTIKAAHVGFGWHLTDDGGVSLYLFEGDRGGGAQPGAAPSDCVGDCLILWPPVPGDPLPAAGVGVNARLIGSFRRPDGKVQATYNGWPLYYFAEDFSAGDINGHQFEEFGGDWYLVTPTGSEIGGKLASGVDYQGGEDCVCHRTATQNLDMSFRGTLAPMPKPKSVAPIIRLNPKLPFAVRFADAFLPDNQTPEVRSIARVLAIRAEARLSLLASTQ